VLKVVVSAIILVGTLLVCAPAASACNGYVNVNGNCIPSPDHNPGTHDRDGTNSHSENRQGSGSWHGGTGKRR